MGSTATYSAYECAQSSLDNACLSVTNPAPLASVWNTADCAGFAGKSPLRCGVRRITSAHLFGFDKLTVRASRLTTRSLPAQSEPAARFDRRRPTPARRMPRFFTLPSCDVIGRPPAARERGPVRVRCFWFNMAFGGSST